MKIADSIRRVEEDSASYADYIYKIYENMWEIEPEAKFRLAYEFNKTLNYDDKESLYDDIIFKSLKFEIDFKNFLPSIIAKLKLIFIG